MERLPLTRSAVDAAEARAQRRSQRSGEAVRIGYGITTTAEAFRAASEPTRHRARIQAVIERSRPGLIVSHASAVVMHELPWFGPFPERVTLTDTSRERAQRLRFSDKLPARGRHVRTVLIDGILTTDLVSTAVDVALRSDRAHAIVVLDAVLRRGASVDALAAEIDARSTRRGKERARRLLELADSRIESPGESLTHLLADDLRLPRPTLQHEFRANGHLVARVDFWFPEHGVVVEFDGLVKYRRRDFRDGRPPEEVVIAEKIREDAVRSFAEVRGFARVTWRDVLPGGCAPEHLRRAGLPVPTGLDRTPAW